MIAYLFPGVLVALVLSLSCLRLWSDKQARAAAFRGEIARLHAESQALLEIAEEATHMSDAVAETIATTTARMEQERLDTLLPQAEIGVPRKRRL